MMTENEVIEILKAIEDFGNAKYELAKGVYDFNETYDIEALCAKVDETRAAFNKLLLQHVKFEF